MQASKFFSGIVVILALATAGGALAAQRQVTPGAAPGSAVVRGGDVLDPGGGGTVQELSVQDCRAMGGTVAVHDGCATVGGNEVGLKCTIGDYAACVDEASAN
jgi:hypothetical protein